MLKSKYLSGKGSMSWSQAQKCWVRIEWILHFQAWALTQGFSRPRRDQQMTTLFKAVAGSPWTGGFFTKWDLVGGEHPPPSGSKMEAAEDFFFFFCLQMGLLAWWGNMSKRGLSLGSGFLLTSSCLGWLLGCTTCVATHGPVLSRASCLV